MYDASLTTRSSNTHRKRRTIAWTSQAAGVYPGLDRFGRVVAQSWLDGVTGSTAAGYRPAIVDQIHTYDLASNRLSKRDGRAGASWLGRDWEYGYDSLGRLTEARQGARTGVTTTVRAVPRDYLSVPTRTRRAHGTCAAPVRPHGWTVAASVRHASRRGRATAREMPGTDFEWHHGSDQMRLPLALRVHEVP